MVIEGNWKVIDVYLIAALFLQTCFRPTDAFIQEVNQSDSVTRSSLEFLPELKSIKVFSSMARSHKNTQKVRPSINRDVLMKGTSNETSMIQTLQIKEHERLSITGIIQCHHWSVWSAKRRSFWGTSGIDQEGDLTWYDRCPMNSIEDQRERRSIGGDQSTVVSPC